MVVDVPYNDDPARVDVVPGVPEALERARSGGLRVGLVTNQSGVAKGLISPERLDAVNARVEALIGPFDVVVSCPHDDGDGCGCRKPQPGMVLSAAESLGVDVSACVVVGDTWSDAAAARAAGAMAVLLGDGPAADPHVVVRPDFTSAVDLVLAWRAGR